MVTIDITPYCGASHIRDIEVLACKIAQNKDEKIVLNLGVEGWDIVENGIEQKVKNICDELNIPYTQIEFSSSDRLCKSTVFKHQLNKNYNSFLNNFELQPIKLPSANKYGLFNGRATDERLYSFWKHKNWQHSDRGKASMHGNVLQNEVESDYIEFIVEHNDKWSSVKNILPYTDLNHTLPPADNMDEATMPILWNDIYSDISIEIVTETNTTADTFFITEKTFRPIVYGRLFMIIGSPDFEQNLKSLGFDIFDDIIDKSYDNESSYIRVDAVFKSLGDLLRNPVDMQVLLPRLQANQRVLENL